MLLVFLCSIALINAQQITYEYVNDGESRTFQEAQDLCRVEYGSDLATVHNEEELSIAIELIGDGPSPWIGLWSDLSWRTHERPYYFQYIGTICPSECNGLYGACVCSELWENGEPLPCTIGSRCTRIIPESGKINNDIPCDDTLDSILCDQLTNFTALCDPYDRDSLITTPIPETTELWTTTWPNLTIDIIFCVDTSKECKCKKNVYVIFYYDRLGEVAFKIAARTKRNEIITTDPAYNSAIDCVIMLPFTMENDFKTQWKAAVDSSAGKIKEVYIYGHSSKSSSGNDGIEFPDGTLTRTEIGALDVLPWQPDGTKMEIHSCNSGVKGVRGWSIASEMAKKQGVNVYGEPGKAYFSTNLKKHSSIPWTEKNIVKQNKIYLRAYHRRDNAKWWGNNRLMPMVCEKPPAPVSKGRAIWLSSIYDDGNGNLKDDDNLYAMIYGGILLFIVINNIICCWWCLCKESKYEAVDIVDK